MLHQKHLTHSFISAKLFTTKIKMLLLATLGNSNNASFKREVATLKGLYRIRALLFVPFFAPPFEPVEHIRHAVHHL